MYTMAHYRTDGHIPVEHYSHSVDAYTGKL